MFIMYTILRIVIKDQIEEQEGDDDEEEDKDPVIRIRRYSGVNRASFHFIFLLLYSSSSHLFYPFSRIVMSVLKKQECDT